MVLATVDGYFQTMTTVLICATRRIKPSLEQKNGLHLHLHVHLTLTEEVLGRPWLVVTP
jgi:hypothetical protein